MINLPQTSPCTKPKAHSTSHPSVLAWKPWQSTFNYTSNWLWKQFIAGARLSEVIGVGADGRGGYRSWPGIICMIPLQKTGRGRSVRSGDMHGSRPGIPRTIHLFCVLSPWSSDLWMGHPSCDPCGPSAGHQGRAGDYRQEYERPLFCLPRSYQQAYRLSSGEAARVRVPFLT